MSLLARSFVGVLIGSSSMVFSQAAYGCDPSEQTCQVVIVGQRAGSGTVGAGKSPDPSEKVPVYTEPVNGEPAEEVAAQENRCAFSTDNGTKVVTSTSSQADRLAAATSAFIAMRRSMNKFTFDSKYGSVSGGGGYFQVVYADGAIEAWNVLDRNSPTAPLTGPAGAMTKPNPDQSCSGIV
jgi:hypothetical protein